MAQGLTQIQRLAVVAIATIQPLAIVSAASLPGNDVGTSVNRVVVTLNASDSKTEVVTIGRAVMLHAFRVEAVDGARSAFAVTLNVGTRPLVRLNQTSREITLPKPLGMRIEATDSIRIAVAGTGQLRLTIEFDVLEGAASRLAVRPSQLDIDEEYVRTTSRTFNWTAETSGRMLAIAGGALKGAKELVLQDAATGDVLWRAVLGQATQAQRLGVVVEAGRAYKLTAKYGVAAECGSMVALALPSRAR